MDFQASNIDYNSALGWAVMFVVGTICIIAIVIIVRTFLGKIKKAKIGKILEVETTAINDQAPTSKHVEETSQKLPNCEEYYKLGCETGELRAGTLLNSQMNIVDARYKLFYEKIKDILVSLFQNSETKLKMISPMLFVYAKIFNNNFKTLFKLTNGVDLAIVTFEDKCKTITNILLREYRRIIGDYYDEKYFGVSKNVIANLIEDRSYGLLPIFNNMVIEVFSEARKLYINETVKLNNRKKELDNNSIVKPNMVRTVNTSKKGKHLKRKLKISKK